MPGLVGRHPDDAEERMERDLSTGVGASDPRVCVELPVKSDRLTLADTEPIVERRATSHRPA